MHVINKVLRVLIKGYHFSNLNRSRYAPNDDTLYVAPEDERTDYVCRLGIFFCWLIVIFLYQSQPPMANWYSGVLK